jgi:hypothetical protein
MTAPFESRFPVPSNRNQWLTVLAVLGCFLVFILILFVAHIPVRRAAEEARKNELKLIDEAEQWKLTAQGRRERLDKLRDREREAAATYAWIDEKAGIVRLPIERAMELVVQEHTGGQP